MSHRNSSSGSLNVTPTKFSFKMIDCIGPQLLFIINTFLSTGCVPQYFKTACIQPLLKKPWLDHTLPDNCHPISTPPFIANVLENLCCQFQSGVHQYDSIETALLKITNDFLLNADAGMSSVLVLLDFTTAFDNIDHRILLNRLSRGVGTSDVALHWFSSNL